jgi:hypothetical protein
MVVRLGEEELARQGRKERRQTESRAGTGLQGGLGERERAQRARREEMKAGGRVVV